ncbi:MAG: ABC transporter permease [Burkholderiales bacterium]|nr:MAG: ABC transporter permease [Burkholderiales bacterium]
MQTHSAHPVSMATGLWLHRELIMALVRREIVGRYRGSVMGLLWSFFNPVLMLAVYTFVFSVVFKARWTGGSESRVEFALVLFSGLMVFNIFAESINRAPGLVLGNANYVKKVIFPLEILPVVTLGASGFHFLISFAVWLVFYLLFFGIPPATLLWLPLTLLPLLPMTLGLSWLLASLGVYLRDVAQVVGVLTTILMFMSPIFYPIQALPQDFQFVMQLSPLSGIIEQARNAMIWGQGIEWEVWSVQMLLSMAVGWCGFAWFQKTRKGFADVI